MNISKRPKEGSGFNAPEGAAAEDRGLCSGIVSGTGVDAAPIPSAASIAAKLGLLSVGRHQDFLRRLVMAAAASAGDMSWFRAGDCMATAVKLGSCGSS